MQNRGEKLTVKKITAARKWRSLLSKRLAGDADHGIDRGVGEDYTNANVQKHNI